MLTDAALSDGRAALASGEWEDARSIFAACETAQELEGFSWAAWWLDDVEACLDARERAFRAYRDAGDCRGAARMALWLSDDHVEFRGEEAIANGWLQRARTILAEQDLCPEHGWLEVFEAHGALLEHDHATARRVAASARGLGRRFGDVSLEMLSLVIEGMAYVAAGEVGEGMRRLDEGTAAALSGEYEDLRPAGWACCCMISTCEEMRDHGRAAQWCRKVDEFSSRLRIAFVNGTCRAHYGAILTWRGEWDAAERELSQALRDLTTTRPVWRAEAIVRLGDLRRRQGRFAEAEELFRQAPQHALSRLGVAELALDRGDVAAARDALERLLRRLPTSGPVARAAPLELLVRAEAAAGDREAAARHAAELRAIAGTLGTRPLAAAADFSQGLAAAAAGDHATARERFEDAVDLLADAAPLEAGRAQTELARALRALERPDAAVREATAAMERLRGLGAVTESARARVLLEQLGVSARPSGPLTARELQVLGLVAEGLGDREIAARLTLSEHTVHRHVANIHAKLRCSSRAAAVASASRLQLL
jgi:DNA-binding CsgD family transcriptional regulator